MRASILLVEDEPGPAQVVESTLRGAGHKVLRVSSADAALSVLKKESFDLLLLDIGLPGLSGMQLLEVLKKEERTAGVPVMMLTALADTPHKVQGLHGGADDYLVKPFAGAELLARVEALLRRAYQGGKPANTLSAAGIAVDLDRREVIVRGGRVALTPAEFDLLSLLMRRKGFVLSYATIAEAVSKGAAETTSETLYAHVKNLRKKLGDSGGHIETVHGVGYKFSEL